MESTVLQIRSDCLKLGYASEIDVGGDTESRVGVIHGSVRKCVFDPTEMI